jgi:acyl carrier protein
MTVRVDVDELIDLIGRELDLDEGEIGPHSTMDDVAGWDSLGHLRVCMAMEARYGMRIPMERVPELRSVPAIVELVAGR